MPSPPTLHNLHLTIALYLPNPSKIQSPIPTLDTTYSLPLTRKKKKKPEKLLRTCCLHRRTKIAYRQS
ncbi:hypothetical protein PG995_012734 [Apiospora arundinis]|uniref:Uncharacterized protein n=1 Tax=Apiospora arundinis TaxID=335852 RepID=A0ABR2I5F2_9PEZI